MRGGDLERAHDRGRVVGLGRRSAARAPELSGRTPDLTIGEDDRRLYVLNQRQGRVRILTLNPSTLSVLGSSGRMGSTTTGIVDLPNNIGGFSRRR